MPASSDVYCSAVVVCDDVIVDADTSKLHLIGVFATIRAAQVPYRRHELTAFVQLSVPRGEYRVALVCVGELTDQELFGTPIHVLRFERERGVGRAIFRICDATFPDFGPYRIECYCDERLVGVVRFSLAQRTEADL